MLKKTNLILLIAGIIIGSVTVYWFLLQNRQSSPGVTTANISPTVSVSELIPTNSVVSTPIPTTGTQKGTIEGSMGFPSEGIPAEVIVCAEDINTKVEFCTSERISDSKYTYRVGYKLEVPVGSYYVYEKMPPETYRAYYNVFVTCGLSANCTSHKPIVVEVKAGQTTDKVDPQDWYNQSTPTP